MNNKYYFLIWVLLSGAFMMQAQTSLEGKVMDAETGEGIIFADVALYKNGNLIGGTQTDFDGNYNISNLDGGTYDVEASYIGYQKQRQTSVVITSGRLTRLDFKLGSGIELDVIEIVEYKKPLIEQDNTSSGGALTSEDIERMPIKNVNALASTSAGLSSTDGGDINVRGGRSSGTVFFLDGIRVTGTLPPQTEIEQLNTLIGGIPASFGDVTGGVISVTSKGPSSRFSGGIEVETSEFLDPYGYNLAQANLSGPILKNKEGRSVIGFRIAGQYRHIDESSPSAIGVYRATEERIKYLELNPLDENDVPRGEFDRLEVNGGDIQLLDVRPNTANRDYNLTGKLDFRIGGNFDVTLSGNYINRHNQFTPSSSSNTSFQSASLYNWTRNPFDDGTTYRGNLRIRHKLGGNAPLSRGDSTQTKLSSIRNASYTITGGYQYTESSAEDLIHQDRPFEYGYVGVFDMSFEPSIGIDPNTQLPYHTGYNPVLNSYTPNNQGINPAWLALNKSYEEDGQVLNLPTSYRAYNGGRNSLYQSYWNYFASPGTVYNNLSKGNNSRYTLDVRTNFDFIPGSSEKGRHSIEIGFLYEQQEVRNYSLSPERLYTEARQLVNQPILGTGVDSTILLRYDTITDPFTGTDIPVAIYAPGLDTITKNFHTNIRNDLGVGYQEFINIDAIAPGDMKLSWFEPENLTQNIGSSSNLLTYYGYDHLGNETRLGTTFDDFFADANGDGKQDFLVAPFQPNYLAAFIQDKFSYKDIIFRIGARVERYDANTKVLKDPYSLYDVMTVGEFRNQDIKPDDVPSENIPDDLLVYVASNESTSPIAYRRGEQWFDSKGEAVNDGNSIFQGRPAQPYYRMRDKELRNIQTPAYANFLDNSFEDYEPDINIAPRLSFSFPISEASNFFANYDVLYQRPTSGNLYTALDYYYFEERAGARQTNGNPNLKPVQTTQYEVGFNQKISNTSAIKIQAFYKEERDRVQIRTLQNVASPIGSYVTFDNIDFATIKGFSFTYDLRRTGNITAYANYTLQFADGTGSSPTSQIILASTGQNIRTLSPLDFDERHRFNLTLDYRYGEGKRYNGPRLFGTETFANAGINCQFTAVSGKPYTRSQFPETFSGSGLIGELNSSRLPWSYNMDIRVDKDFAIRTSEEGKRPLSFNVYLRVQNVFNTRNIIGVYTYSGDPDDPGFLAHARGENLIRATTRGEESGLGTVASLLDLYSARALNPANYTLPRRIYLGAYFNF